jgi:uncharacterized membrane protein
MLRRSTSGRRAKAVAAFWIGAGTMHFVIPKQYVAIVPDWLPAHRELVVATCARERSRGS